MKDMTIYGSYVSPTELWNQQPMLHASITEQGATMLYIVHNHNTKTSFSTTDLDPIFNELKSGTMEIVDEIDHTFTISHNSAAILNECISSLWELVAYKDDLTKEDILTALESNLHQIDSALTNHNLNQI